eukprot:2633280-Prorocentrum_lima.AAC.1
MLLLDQREHPPQTVAHKLNQGRGQRHGPSPVKDVFLRQAGPRIQHLAAQMTAVAASMSLHTLSS